MSVIKGSVVETESRERHAVFAGLLLYVADDRRLFEKLSLESFQSGLSWRTILVKRENSRAAFQDFDFHGIARIIKGPQEARLEVRRTNNGLRIHASNGSDQRPRRGMHNQTHGRARA